MALKKMRVSFDIDIPVLLQMLAAGHSGIRIDMYGDDKPPKGLKQIRHDQPHAPKLLEGPKPRKARNGKATVYGTILGFLVEHKDRKVKAVELKPLVGGIGAAPNSVSPQLAKLRDDGFVKHGKDGYQVTARGIAHHEKTAHAEETEG